MSHHGFHQGLGRDNKMRRQVTGHRSVFCEFRLKPTVKAMVMEAAQQWECTLKWTPKNGSHGNFYARPPLPQSKGRLTGGNNYPKPCTKAEQGKRMMTSIFRQSKCMALALQFQQASSKALSLLLFPCSGKKKRSYARSNGNLRKDSVKPQDHNPLHTDWILR